MRIMDKVLGFIGYEIDEEEQTESVAVIEKSEDFSQRNRRNNLIGLPSPSNAMKMAVAKPKDFEQVQMIADHLKNRSPVVVNVEELELEMAKRIVDFLSGTIYALSGSIQKVSPGIMIFLPKNVEITGDLENHHGIEDVWPLKVPQL